MSDIMYLLCVWCGKVSVRFWRYFHLHMRFSKIVFPRRFLTLCLFRLLIARSLPKHVFNFVVYDLGSKWRLSALHSCMQQMEQPKGSQPWGLIYMLESKICYIKCIWPLKVQINIILRIYAENWLENTFSNFMIEWNMYGTNGT